jgi:hypothetical protein
MYSDADERETAYFPVTLRGASESPVSMRFGRCLWQKLESESVRYRVVLVCENEDTPQENPFSEILQPEFSRAAEIALRTQVKFDALLSELQQAGVLSSEAIQRIEGSADTLSSSAIRQLDRSTDVEATL